LRSDGRGVGDDCPKSTRMKGVYSWSLSFCSLFIVWFILIRMSTCGIEDNVFSKDVPFVGHVVRQLDSNIRISLLLIFFTFRQV
jgi:hypothetical protein